MHNSEDTDARLFGCSCSGCGLTIAPSELVMKALQYVYHIECFKCHECGEKLEKGDEFLLKDDKLYCSADFNVAEQRSDTEIFSSDDSETMSTTSPKDYDDKNSSKRPRTILTSQQREDFKAAFKLTPKPCRKVREQLSNETGLSVRVVQVWFQNQRAKLKKLQKKAEEGDSGDKIKKNDSNGKIIKKKRVKPNFSARNLNDIPGINDLNVLTAEQLSNSSTNSFTSLLNMGTSLETDPANISYYAQLNPTLLTDTRNINAINTFSIQPDLMQYTRIPPIFNVATGLSPLPTITNTIQTSQLTNVTTAPTGTTNFQLMPHLMNSYL